MYGKNDTKSYSTWDYYPVKRKPSVERELKRLRQLLETTKSDETRAYIIDKMRKIGT